MAIPQRVVIYGRVGHDWQLTDRETKALKEAAARRGGEVVALYIDDAISGASGRKKRPAFHRLLKDASQSKFDVVMVWSIHQMGRSLRELIDTIEHLRVTGIDLYVDQQKIDTTTSAGKLAFQLVSVFAEFPRSSALARARPETKRPGHLKLDPQTEWAICQALAAGNKGMLKIAAEFGVSGSIVQRIKAQMKDAAG